jgi:tripartite-type tricarboxylate transporter receptor subunit TctC
MQRYPGSPEIPSVAEFAPNDAARTLIQIACSPAAIGKSLAAPPGVPAETIAALRQAFAAMLKDADFQADAARRKLPIEAATGEEMQSEVAAVMATPPAAIENLGRILNGS